MTKSDPADLGNNQPAGINREFIEELLHELETIKSLIRTDEARAAVFKDALASRTLYLAGMLIDEVARWALDHKMGLALAGKEGPPVMLGVDVIDRKYWEKAIDSSHATFELRGRHIDQLSIDNGSLRRAAVAVLRPIAQGISDFVPLRQLSSGLDAVEWGERAKIFEPSRDKRQRARISLEEAKMQGRALDFVEFLSHRTTSEGLHPSRENAVKKVADTMGVAAATLRTWKNRLPATLVDSRRSDLAIQAARELNAGRQGTLTSLFSEDALAELGRRYRELRKVKAKIKRAR